MTSSRCGGTILAGLEIGTTPLRRYPAWCYTGIAEHGAAAQEDCVRNERRPDADGAPLSSETSIKQPANGRGSIHHARFQDRPTLLFGRPRGMLPAPTSALYCLTASGVLYQRLPRFIAAIRPCRTNQPK